ncbi:MAG: hypothetical protein MZU97_09220 [Bacillus subtilis]|nr:hypothetical protein [Bacillus subtilis]
MPLGGDSASNRNYSRAAEELQYGVGRTHVAETRKPGMMEEISIAITLDRGAMPVGMNINDLKELIARAANPKAKAEKCKNSFFRRQHFRLFKR